MISITPKRELSAHGLFIVTLQTMDRSRNFPTYAFVVCISASGFTPSSTARSAMVVASRNSV